MARTKVVVDPITRIEGHLRIEVQQEKLHLPKYPTTTIGSFPQTKEIRRLRADLKKGRITQEEYDRQIGDAILDTLRFQEEAGRQ